MMGVISSLRGFGLAAAAVAILGLAGFAPASAAVNFTGGYTVEVNKKDPGLKISTDRETGSLGFNLDVGSTVSVDLFDIWTDEKAINWDDKIPSPMSVAFNFTAPEFDGLASGTTVGASFDFLGVPVLEYGKLVWDEKLIELAFGNGGLLQISLSDVIFNKGFLGTSSGEFWGATVSADFTLVSDSTAVIPLPAGLPLLLSGMGGLAFLRWRRGAAAA